MAREQERAPQAHGTESTNAGAPSDAIYDARVLGLPKMGLLGVQHLFAMFGATQHLRPYNFHLCAYDK